jgi:hypothetical protein
VLEERGVRSIFGYRSSSLKEFWLTLIHPPPSFDRLLWSFNWYQSRIGHLLALTYFVTRRWHEERCYQACRFHWQRFRLLEKLNLQLSLEPGSCYLGDRAGGVRDPGYTWQRGPRWAAKVWKQLQSTQEVSTKSKLDPCSRDEVLAPSDRPVHPSSWPASSYLQQTTSKYDLTK